jgi:hypothetical protein
MTAMISLPRLIQRILALSVLVGALLGAIVLPVAAQDQPASVEALTDRGVQAGLDRSQVQEVVRRARSAGLSQGATGDLLRPAIRLAEQGLPAEHVVNKTLEGLAKRVPSARMSPVLQELTTQTEQAGATVDAWLRRPDVRANISGVEGGERGRAMRRQLIVNAAQAQQQGVPPAFVQSLLQDLPSAASGRSIPAGNVAAAVGILPDVPGATRGAASTRSLITAALDAGYDAESLRQLPAALQSARRSSQRPADRLARDAARAIAEGTPASDVLEGLFRGGGPGAGPPSGRAGPPGGTPPGQGKPPGQGGQPPGRGNPPDSPPGQGGRPDNPPGGGG